jgi:hypothetical protein
MLTISNRRQQRGLEIAATSNMVRKSSSWLVPSQFGEGPLYGLPGWGKPSLLLP